MPYARVSVMPQPPGDATGGHPGISSGRTDANGRGITIQVR